MADMTVETVYHLEKLGTGAGVGWFSCVPEDKPDLKTCLDHLAQRPLDRFMHRYTFDLVRDLGAEILKGLIAKGKSEAPATLALVLEACFSSENLRDLLDHFKGMDLSSLSAHSPEIKVPFSLQETPQGRLYWLRTFSRNNLMHESLPPPQEASFSPLFDPDAIAAWKKVNVPIGRMPFAREMPLSRGRAVAKISRKEPGGIQKLLEGLGILEGWETRTEATLSPFALERPWRLDIHVESGRNRWRLLGTQNSYGRGLNIHQARMSYLMEIAERYAAFASVAGEHIPGYMKDFRLIHGTQRELEGQGMQTLDLGALMVEVQRDDEKLFWIEGERVSKEGPQRILVPAQLVFLFSNLDEVDLTSGFSSNGLGAGKTMEQARLSALLEVIERDGERVMPFVPERCFTVETGDPKVREMLLDLEKKGIHIRLLDITSEFGIPCYKAFVEGPGGVILKGSSADLDGFRAAVGAMTEIPWPYPYWFGTEPPPEGTISVDLEELPSWSTGDAALDLQNLEALLQANGYAPVYVDLTREDTGIPVCRALVPGLEMMTFFDKYTPLGLRQFAHYLDVFEGRGQAHQRP